MKETELKPYLKVKTAKHIYGVCAIYEPHPFRNSAIKESIEQNGGIYLQKKTIGNSILLIFKMVCYTSNVTM